MKILSTVLIVLSTVAYCVTTSQAQVVVLINEVPTLVTLDGNEIISARTISTSYIAEYALTPKDLEKFIKRDLILDPRPVVASKNLAQSSLPKVNVSTTHVGIRHEVKPGITNSLED